MFRGMARYQACARLILTGCSSRRPEPFPETMIAASAHFYLEHALASWSAAKDLSAYDPRALDHYRAAFTPAHIHASCEDYRAGAFIDRLLDEDDLAARSQDRRAHARHVGRHRHPRERLAARRLAGLRERRCARSQCRFRSFRAGGESRRRAWRRCSISCAEDPVERNSVLRHTAHWQRDRPLAPRAACTMRIVLRTLTPIEPNRPHMTPQTY